jgi:hypothetical protein
MSFIHAVYRKYIVDVGIVDLLTAIIYGLAVLALLIALDMWWLFPTLIAVLLAAGALRAWAKARRSAK